MTDFNSQSTPNTSIRDLLDTILRGKFIIAGVAILATALALTHYYTTTPNYQAQAVIMVKSPDKEKLIRDNGAGTELTMQTSVELLKSYPLANAAVRKLMNSEQRNNLELFGTRSRSKGRKSAAPDSNRSRIYATSLLDHISADNIRGTNLIEVSVSSPYPDEAALLANTVCDAFGEKNAEWSAAQDISVSKTIEAQISQQEQKVKESEKALRDFMKNNEVYEATGNVADLQRSYSAAMTEYDANRVQYEILKRQLAFIDDKLSGEEKSFSRNLYQTIGSQLKSMRDNIKAKESTYITLAMQNGNKGPEVEEARNQLINLKAQYDQVNRKKIAGEIANSGNAQKYRFDILATKMQVNVRLAELDNSAREYLRLKESYQSQLNQLPAKQITYAKLNLDNDIAKKTYAFLKEKLDEVRIKAASNVGGVVVINSAFPPDAPKSPSLMKDLLVGIGGGVLVGVLAVVMKEKYV
jgi:uncharacterized protein involved in exopolysaccharide biosynthesis